ncbi:unnamed protein product, partial [Pylaiella littoralis]
HSLVCDDAAEFLPSAAAAAAAAAGDGCNAVECVANSSRKTPHGEKQYPERQSHTLKFDPLSRLDIPGCNTCPRCPTLRQRRQTLLLAKHRRHVSRRDCLRKPHMTTVKGGLSCRSPPLRGKP